MNSIYKDLSGQGRGRGRGRGRQVTNGGTSSITPWSTRTSNDNINRDHSQSGKASNSSNKKSFNKSATEEHWKKRETASDSRLEKAKKIRQTAAENFSHLLDESDSSDEELKEEEILKNAVKSYKEQFEDENDLPQPNQCLTDLLNSGSNVCPVCIDPVKHLDAVWSCIECYGLFHLQCIQRWAGQNVGAQKIASNAELSEAELVWCCPNCRHDYSQAECPTKYLCFCRKEEDPKFDPWSIPHSCGQKCLKSLTPDCGHACLLLCHPGPCPPCPKTVKAKCHCGRKGPSLKRCCNKAWSCGISCGHILSCGHHSCKKPCHPGECPPCLENSLQPCLCLKKKCLRNCAEPVWQCDEICGKVLSCGNHTCEKTCHADNCGPCPRSQERFCPCGKTSFRLPCTEDIIPCEDTCGKLLECGSHYCHRRCHYGPCETCRQISTKKCRCGKRSKEIPCCQTLTCDFKCNNLRNCGRHPCKRKCCNGNCPRCEQTCNKTLSCRNHKCPAQCHTGPCFPCPLKKDVTCFCGATSKRVNCGAERITKPPRCKGECKIPPTCHHEKRELHLCHFNRCPTCKQICGLPLKSCQHFCVELCHDHIPLEKPKKPILNAWERKPETEENFVARPCAPCLVPLQRECFGKHEVSTFPCSQDKPYSCKRKCGRLLQCGNHFCERECHVVIDAPTENEAGTDCSICEDACSKSRPKGCTHNCKRRCHPGDCPNCTRFVKVNCHCGLIMMEVKCCVLNGEDNKLKSEEISCKNQCPKQISCGHRCNKICHLGSCSHSDECNQKTKIQCPCKRRKKEYPCQQARSGTVNLECDAKCKEAIEKRQKEEDEKAEAVKAKELKKQQEELEWFQRKTQGRKRKHKTVVIEEEKSILQKYGKWIFIPLVIVLISICLLFAIK